MGWTHFPNGVTSMGVPQLGGVIIPFNSGNVWFADAKFGSNGNSGKGGWDNAFETMVYLEGRIGDGTNDVVLIDGLKSSGGPTYKYQEDAPIDWDKDNVHVYGCGTFGATDPLPEWSLNSTGRAVALPHTLKVSGVGNTFTNLRIVGNGTDSASLWALDDAGENNVYTNCQFQKHNDLDSTSVADVRGRGDATTWRNCKFGATWYTIEVARRNFYINGDITTHMKSNYFENCYFVGSSDDAGFHAIELLNGDSLKYENIWKDCAFIATVINSVGAIQNTDAVVSHSNHHEGNLIFINPFCNAANFCSGDSSAVEFLGFGAKASTSTELIGLAVEPS